MYFMSYNLSLVLYYSHRIMVLVEGKIKEYAAPTDLMENSKSLFYHMAKDAGLV